MLHLFGQFPPFFAILVEQAGAQGYQNPFRASPISAKAVTPASDELAIFSIESAQFRKALRRPIPREREYLERQYTGIGLQLGRHSRYIAST